MRAYTIRQVAKKLRHSENWVYELIKRGVLKKIENSNPMKVYKDELEKYMNRVIELQYKPDKVQVIETHLGNIRKIKGQDWYVLLDMASIARLSSSYVIKERVEKDNIKLLTFNEAREYGFTEFNSKGALLINLNGIKEYISKTKTKVNWNLFLKEIQLEQPEENKQEEFQLEKASNNLQMFEGHGVEIILDENNRPLFELYSVGMALGYVNVAKGNIYPHKVRINKVVENADISTVVHSVQQYLTEEMVYDFMLEAKTDKCKAFRKWLTNEVLPTIRKTGGYVNNSNKFVDNYFINFSEEIRKQMVRELEGKNKELFLRREQIEKVLLDNIKVIEGINRSFRKI